VTARAKPARAKPTRAKPTRDGAAADPSARLRAANRRLEERLREAEDTLDAIRLGHVDALVVRDAAGDQVYPLGGADHRYRQLVETMNEGALLVSGDGTIVYANARFAELVERPLERVLGTPLRAHVVERSHVVLDAVLAGRGGGSSKAEVEVRTGDDRRVPVYLSATASWDQDLPLTCVIATDLGEQQRSQDALAAERLAASIVDQVAEGIVVCDLTGRVIRASQTAHRLAGANPLLRPFEEAYPLHLAGNPAIGPRLVASALRGDTVNGVEVELGDRMLLLSAGPVADRDGAPLGCVISFVDVTDRRRAAEERLQILAAAQHAQLQAEAANRAKDEFLAMLGHELRNPLAPIITALELMRLKDDNALRRERAIIDRQVKHLVRLVEDLLDVSRIAEGKVALDRKPVELARIVHRAIEQASPLIEERRHHLDVQLATGLWIEADDLRLCQVIANLLTNAAKYTAPGGHIAISAIAEHGEVVLTVRDDGMGIPREIQPRLFDRFVQGKRSIARSEGGLGLGLAIVRSLVTMHGGVVTVHSDGPGTGSRFAVRLPTWVRADEEAHERSARRAVAGGLRVLVVDDNTDAGDLLAEAIDALGHETRVAYDGPSALALAAQFGPELGFLDIGLPGMDGFELARLLRDADPVIHLIAVTGYGQESDRRRSAAAGFDSHLVKPIAIGELGNLIATARRP